VRTYPIKQLVRRCLGAASIILLTMNSAWACYDPSGNPVSCGASSCDPTRSAAGGRACTPPVFNIGDQPGDTIFPDTLPPGLPVDTPNNGNLLPEIQQVVDEIEASKKASTDNFVLKFDPFVNFLNAINKRIEQQEKYIEGSKDFVNPEALNKIFTEPKKMKSKKSKLTADQMAKIKSIEDLDKRIKNLVAKLFLGSPENDEISRLEDSIFNIEKLIKLDSTTPEQRAQYQEVLEKRWEELDEATKRENKATIDKLDKASETRAELIEELTPAERQEFSKLWWFKNILSDMVENQRDDKLEVHSVRDEVKGPVNLD